MRVLCKIITKNLPEAPEHISVPPTSALQFAVQRLANVVLHRLLAKQVHQGVVVNVAQGLDHAVAYVRHLAPQQRDQHLVHDRGRQHWAGALAVLPFKDEQRLGGGEEVGQRQVGRHAAEAGRGRRNGRHHPTRHGDVVLPQVE